jgi:hypothetical protein
MNRLVPLFSVVFIVLGSCQAVIPDRVHFIDASTTYPNYLFRGAIPLTKDHVFQMDSLQQQLRVAAAFENITLPSGPLYIVGMSIKNYISKS